MAQRVQIILATGLIAAVVKALTCGVNSTNLDEVRDEPKVDQDDIAGQEIHELARGG